jgi:hypothetical protein
MAYNTTSQLRDLYFQHSPYSINRPEYWRYDSLFQWPANGYFKTFARDAALLRQTLTTYGEPEVRSVAEQVFGSQARQQRIGLTHQSNALYERALLHAKHLREIDHRLMQCHERLSIIKMHFPVDGGRTQQNLERLLLQLEQERRTEEITFWKDTIEIRQKLFDQAAEYGATRRRKNMLYGVEEENG